MLLMYGSRRIANHRMLLWASRLPESLGLSHGAIYRLIRLLISLRSTRSKIDDSVTYFINCLIFKQGCQRVLRCTRGQI